MATPENDQDYFEPVSKEFVLRLFTYMTPASKDCIKKICCCALSCACPVDTSPDNICAIVDRINDAIEDNLNNETIIRCCCKALKRIWELSDSAEKSEATKARTVQNLCTVTSRGLWQAFPWVLPVLEDPHQHMQKALL